LFKQFSYQELSAMKGINPRDLVNYYRGVVRRFGTMLCEDTIMVETRPKSNENCKL